MAFGNKKTAVCCYCCCCILSLEGGKCFTCFWHLKMLLVLLHTQSGRHVCECVSNLCSLFWSTPYTAVSCWQWNCAWGVFIVLMMHGSRKGGADKFAKCFKCIQITLQCSGSTRLMGSSCASVAGSFYRVQAIGKCQWFMLIQNIYVRLRFWLRVMLIPRICLKVRANVLTWQQVT